MSTHLHQPQARDSEWQRLSLKTWFIVIAACVGNVQQLFSVVTTAGLAFNATATLGASSQAMWLNQVFMILPASLGPPVGLASDLFGRRYFLLVAYALGLAGSILSAQASSIAVLLLGRLLTAGTSLVQPLLLSIPSEVLPRRWRPLGQAAVSASAGFFAVIALVLSGIFIKFVDTATGEGWRWVWRIEAILEGLTFIITAFLYNPPPHPDMVKLSFTEKIAQLDLVSSILILFTVIPLAMGLQWGNNPYPWTDPHAIAPTAIGVVFLGVLCLYAWKGRRDGLVNHALFSQGNNFAICLLSVFVEGMVFIGYISYYGAHIATTWSSDPLYINLRVACLFLAAFVTAPLVGWYSVKTKNLKFTLLVGYLLFLIALIGLSTTSAPKFAKVSIFWGVLMGCGITFPNLNLLVITQLAVPAHLLASASSLYICVRSIGGGVSVAILASVINSKIAKNLPSYISAVAIQDGVPSASVGNVIELTTAYDAAGLVSLLSGMQGTSSTANQTVANLFAAQKEAFGASYRFCWIALIPFVCLAGLCIVALKDPRDEMNQKIDAPADEPVRRSFHSLRLPADVEMTSKTPSKSGSHASLHERKVSVTVAETEIDRTLP